MKLIFSPLLIKATGVGESTMMTNECTDASMTDEDETTRRSLETRYGCI